MANDPAKRSERRFEDEEFWRSLAPQERQFVELARECGDWEDFDVYVRDMLGLSSREDVERLKQAVRVKFQTARGLTSSTESA